MKNILIFGGGLSAVAAIVKLAFNKSVATILAVISILVFMKTRTASIKKKAFKEISEKQEKKVSEFKNDALKERIDTDEKIDALDDVALSERVSKYTRADRD